LFTTVAVFLLAATLTAAVAEWVSGLALKAIRGMRPAYISDYSDDVIRQLYDTDDAKQVRSMLAEGSLLTETAYSPFVEYRMMPSQGKHVNIADEGFRGNGHGPRDLTASGRKVFVFGGATTLGTGVADNETIPAYLEDALRLAGRGDVQVFNFASAAYYSTLERIRLEQMLTAGIKPDVAVFVDGLEDFYHCAVPDRSSWTDRLAQLSRARSRLPVLVELTHRSNVVLLARHFGGDKSIMVRESGSFCETEAEIDQVVARLDTNRRMIDAIAERMGFKAVFVQQPVPTFSYDNRKRPFPVKEEMLGYHMNSARGYPKMAALHGSGGLWERNLLWLAELEPAEGNAYVDVTAYSPRFNRAIADRIATRIIEGGLLQ
jgi:hypothetical protein